MKTSEKQAMAHVQTGQWLDYYNIYYERHRHTAVGNLKICRDVESTQLQNRRDILVYLPPSYDSSPARRYPVVYMHDGYNLFDEATSYVGEWQVDETMELLSEKEGMEAIIVGIPSMGEERIKEYSPFPDSHFGGGRGKRYLEFIVETLKPLVDDGFRTLPGKRYTGIAGSSMGGLISLYAFFEYPMIFGFSGVMSPSLWFADGAIFDYVKKAAYQEGKIYLDAGTREMGGVWPDQMVLRARSRRYYGRVRLMKRLLVKKGYRPTRTLRHVEGQGAAHDEAAWARRLPEMIRFFMNGD